MNHRRSTASAVLVALLSATALASADAAHATATAAPAKAKPYTVTTAANDTNPLVGTRVKVKGAVSPAAPGAKVKLQVRYAGDRKWKQIDTATLSGNSKYKFKDKVTTVRERTYRVVKPGSRQHAGANAKTEKVTVYGWRPLTSLAPVIADRFFEVASVSVNGVGYADSLSSAAAAPAFSTDYNLNRKCTALEATYAASDSSPVGSTATVGVSVDGVQGYSGTFGLTQSAVHDTSLDGAFRVTLSGSTTGGATAVVATPRVLCSF